MRAQNLKEKEKEKRIVPSVIDEAIDEGRLNILSWTFTSTISHTYSQLIREYPHFITQKWM